MLRTQYPDLLQMEHPEIVTEIGVGYGKVAFGIQKLHIPETGQDRTKINIEDQLEVQVPYAL